ncbi:hypothetical protein [Phytoactinopolyspora endophytica]|uniref:hypothetical protein n=1 Tax=Phytoactinopolyspora endophytica TaxID=1642495 RepID=UPI00101DBAAC|nr:hypothetical protein [Phytoactinopolyspora endophytica]
MTEPILIPVETLRRAAQVLLEHVARYEGEVVAIDKDYYWSIAPEQLYDVFNEPSGLTIGQLTECLENLDAIVADPTRATSHALTWLADLTRAIGHAVVT